MAGLKMITPPATEPVELSDIKPQLRIDLGDDSYDDVLTPLIPVARDWCEGYQNRAYITQTLELALDAWPCTPYIRLPRPPLQSVTSITYTDREGNETTWDAANYIVNDYEEPARIVRAAGWPYTSLAPVNGIKVRYVAGYGSAADVPQRIKQAIILYISELFETPGCLPSDAVKALLDLDRLVPI